MEEKEDFQMGRFPSILINAETLSEAYHKAALACYKEGCRVETPKHRLGMSHGYDAHISVNVTAPLQEPILHKCGIVEDARGIMQYVLEVTHGIHDHWKKDPNNPNDKRWGYTYHGRFISQIPFVLAKINQDWKEKGRISGRDYSFNTWSPREDSILEQQDPPCWQFGQLRFIKDEKGEHNLNYLTCWRSRDLAKAWLENNIAQTRQQKLFADKVSNMLGIPIHVGSYIDTSTSLHLYGLYLDRDNLKQTLERMDKGKPEDFGMSLEDYLGTPEEQTRLKRIISAQSDAESKGKGFNIGEDQLIELGYNLDSFPYPADWDSWPKEWDAEPDPNLLRG